MRFKLPSLMVQMLLRTSKTMPATHRLRAPYVVSWCNLLERPQHACHQPLQWCHHLGSYAFTNVNEDTRVKSVVESQVCARRGHAHVVRVANQHMTCGASDAPRPCPCSMHTTYACAIAALLYNKPHECTQQQAARMHTATSNTSAHKTDACVPSSQHLQALRGASIKKAHLLRRYRYGSIQP